MRATLMYGAGQHVRHILSDPRVSAAIYSHPGPSGGNLGLQISGTAEHLTCESSASGWQSFKIKPREIWCFDSRVFGRERRQVDISDLRLLLPTAWGRLKRACRECR